MNLTDTHCHLNFHNYHGDLGEILERARNTGLSRILVPAIDLSTSHEIIKLVESDPMLFAAVGVHPNSGTSWNESTLEEIKASTQHPKVVAIGEIGLDYFRDRTPIAIQKDILVKQLDLALEINLPVILHVRNKSEHDRRCIEDLLQILEDWVMRSGTLFSNPENCPGVIHSFSGNTSEGLRAIEAGFYLGITGPVTFKKADQLRDLVREIDLSRLFVETDGPFLSPDPYRGKRNEPAHVRYIIDKISEVKGVPFAVTANQTAENAARVFKWE